MEITWKNGESKKKRVGERVPLVVVVVVLVLVLVVVVVVLVIV